MRLGTVCLSVVALATFVAACEDDSPPAEDGATSDGLSVDAGADILPPVPTQVCSSGLVSTHLPDPVVASAMALGGPIPDLRLAGGTRRLVRGVATARLRLRLAGSGALALAYTPPWTSWPALAALGIRRIEHVHDHYHIVAVGRRALVDTALGSGLLLALDLLRPEDKLPPAARGDRKRLGRMALFADASGRRWQRSFDQLGLPLTRAGELAAAAMPWVYRVGARHVDGRPQTFESRASIHTEELQGFSVVNSLPSYTGFTGEGIVVIVNDTGVDGTHLDLHAYDEDGNDLGTRVEGDPPSVGILWHGTAVSAVLAGRGTNSEGFLYDQTKSAPYQWRGHAPGVSKIVSVAYNKGLIYVVKAAVAHRAHLSNHSIADNDLRYANTSRTLDEVLHSGYTSIGSPYPARPMVWSAGNSGLGRLGHPTAGYYSLCNQSKNPIVVGSNNANDDTFSTWSSHGPTFDGRIKPDVVAPGGKNYHAPDGMTAEVDEIVLRARAGSGASDKVWSFDTDGDMEGWKLGSHLEQAAVKDGVLNAVTYFHIDRIEAEKLQGASVMRQEQLALNADDYESLEMVLRFKMNTPGSYRFVGAMGVTWDNDADADYDAFAFSTDVMSSSGQWITSKIALPASSFSGTVGKLHIIIVSNLEIVTAQAGTQTYASRYSGTSYSAPATCGVLAQLMQQYREQKGVDLDKHPPWPSTFKGLLIHTATDMTKDKAELRDPPNPDTGAATLFGPGPDFATGYGRIHAMHASELVEEDRPKSARKVVEQSISAGELHTYAVPIDGGVNADGLRVTLVWDDAPGNPLLAVDVAQLVNDLDLVAISPSGKAHGPWLLEPLPFDKSSYVSGKDPIAPADVKPASRCVESVAWEKESCVDRRNNVEVVDVESPEAGWWTIQVRGHKVPVGPQRYSLLLSASCN